MPEDAQTMLPGEESVWAQALAALSDAVILTDDMGQVSWMNAQAEVLTGWKRAAAVGHDLAEVLCVRAEMADAPTPDLAARVIQTGALFDFASAHQLLRPDGTWAPINGSVAPVRDRTGAIVGTVSLFRDISDRKKLESALQASERMLRIIFENASDGINIYEEDPKHHTRRLIDCNERYAEMAGRSKEELLRIGNTSPLQRKVGPVTPALNNSTLRRRHLPYRGLISWIRPDGKENIVEYAAVPVEIDGRPCTVGLDRDITEQARLQEALHQRTQELEALTETLHRQAAELRAQNAELDAFAHTVAHDMKNSLTIIFGTAQLIHKAVGETLSPDIRDHLDAVLRHAQKLRDLVGALLLLAQTRKQEVTMVPLDMSAVVHGALQQLQEMIQANGAVVIVPSTWPTACGYGPWVEQIWVNYVSNAIKYGGTPSRVELGATAQDDGMVRFWVRDNGAGLTPEEQGKLFNPFTQLGQRVKGHGLGLSIVHRIVTRLGGTVAVESECGNGSVFSFTLPAAPAAGVA